MAAEIDFHPIEDLTQWARGLDGASLNAFHALGELLLGLTDRETKTEDAAAFTQRSLGVSNLGRVVDERCVLGGIERLTYALAVAEMIDQHDPELGPGEYTQPPSWGQTLVHEALHRHPQLLRAAFSAGTLLEAACVVHLDVRLRHRS